MTVLDLNVDDAYEPEMLPADSEVKVRVASAEVKKSAKGNSYINIRLEPINNPRAKDIYFMLGLPDKADDEKTSNAKKIRIKALCEACDLPTSSIDLNGFIGKEFYVLVRAESDPEFGDKNTVKKIVSRG
jgi:hypothetical protein